MSCTNETSRSLSSYNSQQQDTIGEIKYVTLSLCALLDIKTTCNIQFIDMKITKFSIILGRYWQALIGGYIYLYGSHISLLKNEKNIIVLREG